MKLAVSFLVKAVRGCIFFIVVLVPLFYFKWSVYPEIFPKTLFFQALVEAAVFLWIPLAILSPRHRPRLGPVGKALAALLLVTFVTAVTGADFARSFWSTQERTLGIFALLHLFALFVIATSLGEDMPWRKLVVAASASAAVVSALGLVQLAHPAFLLESEVSRRPGSTFGNPTFLSGYLIFTIFLTAYLLHVALRESRRPRGVSFWALGTSLVFQVAALAAARTRGSLAGFFAGVIFLAAVAAARSRSGRLRLTMRGILAIAAVLVAVFAATRANPFWESVPVVNRFQSALVFSSRDFAPRLVAVRAALQGFAERPMLGWGIENFNIVSNKYYDPRSLELGYTETRFDKPHNIFLEYLISGGIILFAVFVWFLVILLRALVRLARRGGPRAALAAPYLGAGILAYLIHDLFVFDTLGPLLMLYLGCAWIEYETHGSIEPTARRAAVPSHTRGILIFSSLVTGAILIWFSSGRTLQAAYEQYQGFMSFGKSPRRGAQHFQKAVALGGPYAWVIRRDFAAVASEALFYNPGLVPEDLVEDAIAGMQETAREHPKDAYNHNALADMYNEISSINPQKYLPAAEEEARTVLTSLSPNRQETLFTLAKTKSLEGDNEAALAIIQKALGLNPRIPDAHFYYGLLAFALGRVQEGYQHIEIARALGREWRNEHELRIVGNYYAEGGHYPEAIKLYEKALEADPSDVEAETKLAVVYFMMGEKEAASSVFRRVMAKTDLTKAIGYPSLEPMLKQLKLLP